jgi:hypothetical protein
MVMMVYFSFLEREQGRKGEGEKGLFPSAPLLPLSPSVLYG